DIEIGRDPRRAAHRSGRLCRGARSAGDGAPAVAQLPSSRRKPIGARPLHRHARASPWHPRVETENVLAETRRRGVAFFSALSAAPRDQLVDARPKAWHDERGADGTGPLTRAPDGAR